MSTTVRATATQRVPMDTMRKTALVAGLLYLLTFISIPTLALYSPVLHDLDYIAERRQRHCRDLGWRPRTDRRLRRHRDRGRAVPRRQAVQRRSRARLCHHARLRSRHDLRRRHQPLFGRDLAAGSGRSGRSGYGLARHHRTGAGRDPQLDVPVRADPHAVHERPFAGLSALSLPPRATGHSRAGTDRRARCSSLPLSASCSASTSRSPRGRGSRPSRSPSGSSRLASGSSPRASIRRRALPRRPPSRWSPPRQSWWRAGVSAARARR